MIVRFIVCSDVSAVFNIAKFKNNFSYWLVQFYTLVLIQLFQVDWYWLRIQSFTEKIKTCISNVPLVKKGDMPYNLGKEINNSKQKN